MKIYCIMMPCEIDDNCTIIKAGKPTFIPESVFDAIMNATESSDLFHRLGYGWLRKFPGGDLIYLNDSIENAFTIEFENG